MTSEAETVEVRVGRARLEEVQALAAAFSRDPSRHTEPPLPTGALFWLASDQRRQRLGYAAGMLRPEGIVLGPVYVVPEHRRAGIARALLREIERWAESARIPLVEVAVAADNVAGVGFLQAAGYRTRRLLMARDPDALVEAS